MAGVSSQAFDRLKALENYLEQCKGLANFADIQLAQCEQLVKEIRSMEKLSLEQGAPLLCMVQQNPNWTNQQKETISQAINVKVQASLGKTLSPRVALQDYTWFPVYLTDRDWASVLDDNVQVGHKVDVLMERLWNLGLRAPSEETMAMLTVVLLLREPQRFSDRLQLRSSYISVKDMVKSNLKKRRGVSENSEAEGDVMRVLPAMPSTLDREKLEKVYPGSGMPASKKPDGITADSLAQMQRHIPLRSTNKSIALQLPKSAGLPHLAQPGSLLALLGGFMGSMGQHGPGVPMPGINWNSPPTPSLPWGVPFPPPKKRITGPAVEVVPASTSSSSAPSEKKCLAILDEARIGAEETTPADGTGEDAIQEVEKKECPETEDTQDNGVAKPSDQIQPSQPQEVLTKSALAVNEKLEIALKAREHDKKEKKEIEAEEHDKGTSGPPKKKPACAKSQPMKNPEEMKTQQRTRRRPNRRRRRRRRQL